MKCFCNNEMIEVRYNNIDYYLCNSCGYLMKKYLPSSIEELNRYNKHICDDKYIDYMIEIYEEIRGYLFGNKILDYGCGKIHALSDILNKNGYDSSYYDLYYFDNEINDKYDSIVLIEVFEHISNPRNLLDKLKSYLNQRGRIIIKTVVVPKNPIGFWYLRDITHVSFISVKGMEILGELCGFNVIYNKDKSLFILERI